MEEPSFLDKIEEHKGIIAKVISLYAEDPEDKKDLRQEIIYQTWKSMESFRGEAKFSTWLYKISLNVSLSHINKKKNKTSLLESQKEVSWFETQELSERSDKLYRAIRQLSDVDRGVVMLHLDGYSNEEISDMTGLSKNNAAVKLHRIKQQLTETLNKQKDGSAKTME